MARKKEDDFLDSFRKNIEKIEKGEMKIPKKGKKNIEDIKSSINTNQKLEKKIKSDKNYKEVKLNSPPKSKKRTVGKTKTKPYPTLQLKTEEEIAMDFATKVYQRFNKLVKSVVLFGSTAKKTNTAGSDIDIIIIIDDASVLWDQNLISWYREEIEKLIQENPYKKSLHINTIKLTTWFNDLMRGDPVVINIVRDGYPLIDFGGFFEPFKYLLNAGKIKSTPEAIYSLLQRAPRHISHSKYAELSVIEGLFWAMVDSAHASLIALGESPPSPEHIPFELKVNFVDKKMLKMKYVVWYRDLFLLHKKIAHGEITELKGVEIDEWQERAEEFLQVMAKLVDEIIDRN